ncbi:hypothetical protein D1872_37010 [compost metagenome]
MNKSRHAVNKKSPRIKIDYFNERIIDNEGFETFLIISHKLSSDRFRTLTKNKNKKS